MTALRVLNVNDSPSNRYYVSRVLKSAGWEVLEAATGEDALATARTEKPAVVVLDIELPDISGLDVCRLLRSDPATAGMIIIQTSATFVTSEGKAKGLDSGADQYLTQPFESVELVAMVRNLLRLRDKEIESRERAEQLAVADKRKDEFLAMLAHELRNPLSAISTAAALLDNGDLDPRASKLSTTIARQTRHLARLVDDLLDVSRITRGKIQLQTKPVDFAAALRRFVDSDASAQARKHALELSIQPEPMWIDADATRIEQVLTNLLGNAVKYTQPGGRIQITLRPSTKGNRSTAVLSVKDSGIGIAPESIGAIFDMFFQVDESLARSQSGLGIGLTMVKRLVELHGGTISVASGGVGTGSEFSVELPTVAAPSVLPDARPSVVDDTPFSVLLIDDNIDSCDLYALAFEDSGHRVAVAHDGEEGLRLALATDYDVALVDIGLPRVDGYEVAQRIRAARKEQPILVAITGYGRPEDRKRALEAGFDAHLVKPVELGRLEQTVAKLLAERRTKQRSA